MVSTLRTPDGAIFSPARRADWFDSRHLVRDTTLAQFDDLTAAGGTGLLYGWAAPGIGYVYVTHLDTVAGLNVSGAALAQSAFAEIALAFAAADGIILDTRYTPGGHSDVALAYAGYFTAEPQPAFRKTIRTPGGFTMPQDVILQPQGSYLIDRPVVMLISDFTGGAAEVLALTMRNLPQVTLIGTPTGGDLSDALGFTLPNGWELGLSHQRYLALDGTRFDATGIPPDIAVPVDVAAATGGADTTLQRAIAYLSGL